MLKMMEAFSKASEYCAVDLWVKASNLIVGKSVQFEVSSASSYVRYHFEEKHTM